MIPSPPIMGDMFSFGENSSQNQRSGVTVNRRNIRTSKFGFETVSTIGAILWNDLPAKLKNAESLKFFLKKEKIKLWSPNDWPCKICKFGPVNLGYIKHQKLQKNVFNKFTSLYILLSSLLVIWLYLDYHLQNQGFVKSKENTYYTVPSHQNNIILELSKTQFGKVRISNFC